ncbi:helix-turn-helix domain-containing protein [Streptomyces parvulus]|uniref:helix-turn-helix domain-containing protein n=1 Tax=Streptomyces parvulus TaxID=146923 RepID=UPI00379E1D15
MGEDDVLGSRVWVTGLARKKLGADLKRAYDKGASIRTLAEGCGRSYGFVHLLLTEAGTTLRSRGGDTRGRPAA